MNCSCELTDGKVTGVCGAHAEYIRQHYMLKPTQEEHDKAAAFIEDLVEDAKNDKREFAKMVVEEWWVEFGRGIGIGILILAAFFAVLVICNLAGRN